MNYLTVIRATESGKSAMIKVLKKAGPFTSLRGIGYLAIEEGAEMPAPGTSFPYEGEVDFQPLSDPETGEIRTYSDGAEMKRIVLK